MSSVYILWKRQLIKYWRSKPRILASLAQPVLFLVALGFGMGSLFEQASGGSYVDFLAPGIIAMTVLFTAMFSGIELIWDKQFGFLKETLVAPVSRFKIILGRNLGGATVSCIQGLIVFLICLAVGFRPFDLVYLPLALLFIFLIALLFTTIGTIIAIKVTDMQAFPLVINFVMMPLFFLSGALFPLNNTAKAIGLIANVNPLSYGVDALRFSLSGSSHFNIFLSSAILILLTALVTYIASKLFENVEA